MLFKELFPGYDKVPVTLLGDPAYPLLPYCLKENPMHAQMKKLFLTIC